jgi:hypothetical protein
MIVDVHRRTEPGRMELATRTGKLVVNEYFLLLLISSGILLRLAR